MLVKEAGSRWVDDQCYRLGASLAYYTLYSLFPLLLLSVAALGFFLGNSDVQRARLVALLHGPGPEVSTLIDQTLKSLQSHRTARGWGAVIGVLTLFFGASGVFSELEWSLDVIFRARVESAKAVWPTMLAAAKAKALSFVAVLVTALAILASLVASTFLGAIAQTTQGWWAGVWRVVETVLSLAFVTLLLCAVFRWVPHVVTRWRDLVVGSLPTAVLLAALKLGLAWYLVHLVNFAAYGVVGAVLGLLTWIYAASLVLFFGAEVSRVHAERYGGAVDTSGPAFASKH
jgi:membrane protein